jgi:hypothetical protein
LRELPGVSFGHEVCVECAGRVRDIDDAVLQRIADLEWRHRLWAADIIDLNDTLAGRVDAVDEAFNPARIGGFLGECRYRSKRHFARSRSTRMGENSNNEQKRFATHNVPKISVVSALKKKTLAHMCYLMKGSLAR